VTIDQFIIKYWSQITLALVAIGFAIRSIIELRNRKREIRFSLFQEKKIEAIVRFMERYNAVESMWHTFPIYRVVDFNITTDELDKLVQPLFKLGNSQTELIIYLTKEERQPFDLIVKLSWQLNKIVSDIYFKHITGDKIVVVNGFATKKDRVENECNSHLELIGIYTRKLYS
jgi:hypothetical protein